MIMILGYLFSSLTYSTLLSSNIGDKTDKDKGDHDTGILILLSNVQYTLGQQHRGGLTRIKVNMILGYLFSSLTYSTLLASNIGDKTDKDKGDHDTGIPVLRSLTFSHSQPATSGGKTDKDKSDHDTGILILLSNVQYTLVQKHRGQD